MDLPNELWYNIFSFLTQESQWKFSSLWNLHNLSTKEIELLLMSDNLWFEATKKGYIKLIKLLIKAGTNVSIQDDAGNTSLHWACSFGNKEIVEILINNNIDMNIHNKIGWLAIHCSALCGKHEITNFLIEAGSGMSIKYNIDKN